MVVIRLPTAAATGVTHDRVGFPSRWIVHAPQAAMPQPNFVPVKPTTSRSTHSTGMSAGTSTVSLRPCMFRVALTHSPWDDQWACPASRNGLYLCQAAIHKQLRSRDVATVVRGQEDDGLRDLLGSAAPAERHGAGNHLRALLSDLRRSQQLIQSGSVDGARPHRIDPNSAILQVRGPRPRH